MAKKCGNSKRNSRAKKAGRPPATLADWAPVFLQALYSGLSVTDAVATAGVDYSMPYKRRETDEGFRQAWAEAAERGTELLEQEAARRAYHGTLKPVFHQGVECGKVREYSDTLMIFLLKARNPQKYRDNADTALHGDFILNINVVTVDKPAIPEIEVITIGNGVEQNHPGLPEAEPLS